MFLLMVYFQDDSETLRNELREEISRLREKLSSSNLSDPSSKEDVARMQVKIISFITYTG